MTSIPRHWTTGKFDFASSVQVLHGIKNRTHFHLIYLTRHHVGVEKFKEAERKAMEAMEKARAEAENWGKRFGPTPSLFADQEPPPSKHYEKLRKRSLAQMEERIENLLVSPEVSFDCIWAECMKLPLVWPADVSANIIQRRHAKKISVLGLQPRQRSLKPGHSLRIRTQ